MGITDLFKELKPTVLRETNLDQLKLSNKKVGIDATIWLVAVQKMLIRTEPGFTSLSEPERHKRHANRFMQYCEERFKLLKRHSIELMMVFDGNTTPRKTEIKMLKKKIKEATKMEIPTEILNKTKKQGSSTKAVNGGGDSDSDSDSDSDLDSDYVRDNKRQEVNFKKPEKKYIPDMKRVLEWFIEQGVEFIVAPYEGDAQLTYLAVNGKIDAVITEDSDLIPFGCPHVIFKLDVDTGACKDYSFDRLKNHHFYRNFTKHMLLEMCIILGCDYLPNLQGIGQEKARDAIKEHITYTKFIPNYQKDLKLRVGITEKDKFEIRRPVILKEFKKAIIAFTYQQVYDPDSHTCQRLSHIHYEYLRDDPDEILGPCLKDESVHAIATGERPSEIRKADVIEIDTRIENKRKNERPMFISDYLRSCKPRD